MKDDSKNWIVFAVLAALILFAWPVVTAKFFPAANPPVTRIEAGKTKVIASPAASSAATVQDRATVLRASPRVRIETPALTGSINLKGGRIDDLVLNRYKETIARDSPPIRLLSPSGTRDAYFAEFGWAGDGLSVPGPDTMFAASAPVLSPGKPVLLVWNNATGQRFVTRIAVDDRFMFTVEQFVLNRGAAPILARNYALVSRVGAGPDLDTWTNHVGPIGVFGRGATYDITYDNLRGKEDRKSVV